LSQSVKGLSLALLKWFMLCGGLVLLLMAFHNLLFMGGLLFPLVLFLTAGALVYMAMSGLTRLTKL
jgi:hypothetical protein